MSPKNKLIDTSDNHESRMMIKAAWLHYKENMTQGQIAKRMGIQRVKVNRLIQLAKQKGLVQINIKAPILTYSEVEEDLVNKFGLIESVVVMEGSSVDSQYEILGQGTADWLMNNIKPNMDIGISLGRTLSYLPESYFSSTDVKCNFVDIIGGISSFNSNFSSYNVTSRMAERFHGQAVRLNAPTVVSSPDVLSIIKNEPFVAEVLNRARNCQIIILSCGTVDESALLYMNGFLKKEELEHLERQGAVGDVQANFLDINGDIINSPLDNRVVTLTLDEIIHIPHRVLVASGNEKVQIIRTALKKGIFNILVTDVNTAKAVLA